MQQKEPENEYKLITLSERKNKLTPKGDVFYKPLLGDGVQSNLEI